MRLPEREASSKYPLVSSPLVSAGSLGSDSNDSNPIDISRSAGCGTSYASSVEPAYVSSAHSFQRNYSHRSLAGSHSSSYHRRQSISRSVGSFVGSYEESILNGRMSQTPSKPLDFTASIGVLGRGKCRSSLKCPPHLNVPFPAYFYSETSPYVGQIDLEIPDDGAGSARRGYRIPAEGQLQIIIKNPNKTAVKLFLIPYDVGDMPASSKTFFRQKHYDAGDGDKLRYAIHLQICSPSQGKYYIYKSQRVVFANRVPDGKENLRVVIQAPTPRYTPWVPEKRQRRADRHARPDGREPKFIGGSLLERDHDVAELAGDGDDGDDDDDGRLDGPLRDGQTTPRPTAGQRSSPLFQPRRSSYLRSPAVSALSLVHRAAALTSDGAAVAGGETRDGGPLADRLEALALSPER